LTNLMRGLVSVLCRKVTTSRSWWWSTISYYYDVTYVIQIMLPHLLGQRICCWERSCKSATKTSIVCLSSLPLEGHFIAFMQLEHAQSFNCTLCKLIIFFGFAV
jgi:hypothetical protein